MDDRTPEEMNSTPTRLDDLPPDRQERIKTIIELRRRGLTNAAIAKLVGVGEATIYRDNQILKELAVNRAARLDVREEIGEALNFFDEIADKAMEGCRAATEDCEQVVHELTESGENKFVRKQVSDHSQAGRYLSIASHAKKQKVDTLLQVSTTNSLNKILLH